MKQEMYKLLAIYSLALAAALLTDSFSDMKSTSDSYVAKDGYNCHLMRKTQTINIQRSCYGF